jgi:hypothetical protein
MLLLLLEEPLNQAHAGEGTQVPAVTQEQAAEAIRRLVGDPDYPLRCVSLGTAVGRLGQEYWFAGLEGSSSDKFRVDARTGDVLSAFINSRQDGRYSLMGTEVFGQPQIPLDYARRKAQRLARENYRGFEEAHMVCLENGRVGGSLIGFRWWGKDPQSGAYLPMNLDIGLDPLNGQLVHWRAERTEVTIPLTPRMDAAKAEEIVRQSEYWKPQVQPEVELWVSFTPPDTTRQSLVWHVKLVEPDGSGRPPAIITVDDATGEILACLR